MTSLYSTMSEYDPKFVIILACCWIISMRIKFWLVVALYTHCAKRHVHQSSSVNIGWRHISWSETHTHDCYLQEAFAACGSSSMSEPYASSTQHEAFTPGMGVSLHHSAASLHHSAATNSSLYSRLTYSSFSPSISPFRSINLSSKVSSPIPGHSRVGSPSVSRLGTIR